MPAIGNCIACSAPCAAALAPVPGLKGESATLRAVTCSGDCAEQARRFAARRSAQLQPSVAGMLVAALGVAAATAFIWSGRDLGRALLVLSLFGAGTTRLAYPDAIPAPLLRRWGIEPATEILQWVGVALCLAAVALALVFLLR